MKKTLIVIVACLAIVALWRPIHARRYHAQIDTAGVQRIDVLQTAAPQFWTVPEAEIPTIVRWFNEAQFRGDNDDLAGPGCSPIGMLIHPRAGERIAISIRGDELTVSQNRKQYFLNHDKLERYIRDHQTKRGGC